MNATTADGIKPALWLYDNRALGLIGLLALALALVFYDALRFMVEWWSIREEYSHGFLIPPIAAFLIWQKRDELDRTPFVGTWWGSFIALLGLAVFTVGELSTIYAVTQYAFLTTLAGLLISFMGWRAFRLIWVAVFILVFMIPLPNFLYNNLSAQLQLISSELGVWVIRSFGISVFLEGNVIDLGTFQLQVVEACNGLRYLFPLMTLGFIVACFYRAAWWKRAAIFLSTVPITVLMNSFRIGMIGVLVEYFGKSQAEGFLHDFEGWVIFMACFGVLFLEMWLLVRLSGDKRPFRDIFALELPAPRRKNAQVHRRVVPRPAMATVIVLLLAVIPARALPQRTEVIPPRQDFSDFPLQVGEWEGRRDKLEEIYIEALKFTDYVVVNYANDTGRQVNFYVAYYESQRKGQSTHSPRTCLPGGGWQIAELGQRQLADVQLQGQAMSVNRAVIRHGRESQLVYYWFQQRGRVITNEYLVKWHLFWDALTRNRTDGALVRLILPLRAGENAAEADAVLAGFTTAIARHLHAYIPD